MQGKEREKRLKREKIMLNPARCVYYFDNRFLMAWEKVIPISFPIFWGGNAFAAGEANFGQAMYRSIERSPQDTRYGFDLYSAQASLICLTARWSLLRRLSAFWIMSLEIVKVFWIRFCSWESFIGFYIWYYPISEIIAWLFTVGVRISWKSCVGKGAFAEIRSSASYLACVIILYRG